VLLSLVDLTTGGQQGMQDKDVTMDQRRTGRMGEIGSYSFIIYKRSSACGESGTENSKLKTQNL
jgi:hypothetical protein